jgi:hypothetical protein
MSYHQSARRGFLLVVAALGVVTVGVARMPTEPLAKSVGSDTPNAANDSAIRLAKP